MSITTAFVKHRIDGYVGVRDGMTTMRHLFESRHDSVGCRVRLPDGTIKIASPRNLIDLVGKDHIVEVHRQKLERQGMAYAGFRVAENVAALGRTPCRGCDSLLPSSWGLECCACNGTICDCATCLCGPKRRKKKPRQGPAATA
jgi:hypothetical protein